MPPIDPAGPDAGARRAQTRSRTRPLARPLALAAIALGLAMLVGAGWWEFGAPRSGLRPAPAARNDAPDPARLASLVDRRAARVEDLSPFGRAAFARASAVVGRLYGQGDRIGAEIETVRLLARYPRMISLHVAAMRLQAERGAPAEAALHLLRAVESGLRDVEAPRTAPVFAAMRAEKNYAAAMAALAAAETGDAATGADADASDRGAETVGAMEGETGAAAPAAPAPRVAVPAPLIDGKAVVGAGNSEWSEIDGAVRAYFALPPDPPGPAPVIGGAGPASGLLNRLIAAGQAAGNRGDFYENRDDDHSALNLARFPQITPIEHAPEARVDGFARSAPLGLAVTAEGETAPPLLGNSSTAITRGSGWRSIARLMVSSPETARELWREYASNQIYVYPEHKDHDPLYGDVFPANTPYQIVSQGSSWSDETAMEGVATILAAFRPETKAALIRERLIAPTVQMIWRRCQKPVQTDAEYLSGIAHPTVFDPANAEPERMVRMANALLPSEIPPAPRLQLLDQRRPARGVTLFGDGLSETLFATPSAIALLFRGADETLRFTVTAAGTSDPNGRPLSFRWVLLRGDPARVRIRPLGDGGQAAEIAVDWQQDVPVPGDAALRSQRIDVAVFADNGAWISAPGMISVAFPPREKRVYGPNGRLDMLDFDALARQDAYADPALWPVREWRDVALHDRAGRPLGWTRSEESGFARFTRHGARVIESDDQGRPLRAAIMAYPMAEDGPFGRRVAQVATGSELVYDYAGPDDLQGVARPAPAPEPAPSPPEAPAAADRAD